MPSEKSKKNFLNFQTFFGAAGSLQKNKNIFQNHKTKAIRFSSCQ